MYQESLSSCETGGGVFQCANHAWAEFLVGGFLGVFLFLVFLLGIFFLFTFCCFFFLQNDCMKKIRQSTNFSIKCRTISEEFLFNKSSLMNSKLAISTINKLSGNYSHRQSLAPFHYPVMYFYYLKVLFFHLLKNINFIVLVAKSQ